MIAYLEHSVQKTDKESRPDNDSIIDFFEVLNLQGTVDCAPNDMACKDFEGLQSVKPLALIRPTANDNNHSGSQSSGLVVNSNDYCSRQQPLN
ncbi:hypothetical protein QN277_018256 [Acacia crassicarpa]|uniref:Uncharacterized protein n=1 Tax=Acacia crassicarpa TaxID=499986 RepID=A0AAE1JR48_9FABA|nr:hypothetical protein QN277_018256 [Acacia crassicarpa]